MKTKDGLTIYDLSSQASELWVVAGPSGYDSNRIDVDDLPDGFRWVTADEWEQLQSENMDCPYCNGDCVRNEKDGIDAFCDGYAGDIDGIFENWSSEWSVDCEDCGDLIAIQKTDPVFCPVCQSKIETKQL